MKRRDFVSFLGGAAMIPVAWPITARAQQSAVPVIGFLNSTTPEAYASNVTAFLRGLKDTGYVEGQNVTIEYRWAEGRYDRLPGMAADLVRRQVAVIAANTPAAPVAKTATTKIPIVFLTGDDPVENGLVTSLNRPGGNATGVTTFSGALAGKQLGVLRQLLPTAASIAYLVNPTNPLSERNIRAAQRAAGTLGQQIHILNASTETEIDAAFQLRTDALDVAPDTFFLSRIDQLVSLPMRYALPTMYAFREFTAAGGLMSYGTNIPDQYRQMGVYTGKILQGAKPADLPVLQPIKFELVINLKTARALGLTIPPSFLALADEIIE